MQQQDVDKIQEEYRRIAGLRTKREEAEDSTPLWVKIFGGSILSVCVFCVITLSSYIVNNLNSIQTKINVINSDVIFRKEFNEQKKIIIDWESKYEVKIDEQNKAYQSTNKDSATYKERINNIETQLNQTRDELRQLQKDVQIIRERIAVVEGKNEGKIEKEKEVKVEKK